MRSSRCCVLVDDRHPHRGRDRLGHWIYMARFDDLGRHGLAYSAAGILVECCDDGGNSVGTIKSFALTVAKHACDASRRGIAPCFWSSTLLVPVILLHHAGILYSAFWVLNLCDAGMGAPYTVVGGPRRTARIPATSPLYYTLRRHYDVFTLPSSPIPTHCSDPIPACRSISFRSPHARDLEAGMLVFGAAAGARLPCQRHAGPLANHPARQHQCRA